MHKRLWAARGIDRFLSLLLCAQVIATGPAQAQKFGDPAPPEVVPSAIARAEQFLKEIARLSPMPLGTDADRAQAWPRRSYREVREEDPSGGWRIGRVERRADTKVVAGLASDDPRSGLRWRVNFYSGELAVEVDPSSKIIVGYNDGVLGYALHLDRASEPEECITAEAAVARALLYLRKTGIDLSQFALSYVSFVNGGYPANAGSRFWSLDFARVWRDVPYANQGMHVTLDARCGRLMGLGVHMAALPPASDAVHVSLPQAARIARRKIEAESAVLLAEPAGELRVVLPSNFWTAPNHYITEWDLHSRLAWVVRAPAAFHHKGLEQPVERLAEVSVDAATGVVLDGNISTVMGGRPGARPSVPGLPGGKTGAQIRTARRLEVARIIGAKGAASRPRSIDRTPDPVRFYGLLAGIVGPLRARPAGFKPDVRLTVVLASGGKETFTMDSKTGTISSKSGEMVQAGPSLWALAKSATVSSTKTTSRR